MMHNSWPVGDVAIWNATAILAVVLLCIGTLSLLANSTSAGLSHIRGPSLAKYTNAYGAVVALKLSRARSGPVVAKFSRKLQAKYGTTVRTGPNSVTILDPRAIPPVYGVRAKLDKVRISRGCGRRQSNFALERLVRALSHGWYYNLSAVDSGRIHTFHLQETGVELIHDVFLEGL